VTVTDSRVGTVHRTVARPLTRSLAVTGTLAVLQAVFVSLVLVELLTLSAWAVEQRATGDSTTALRVGGSIWLTAVHTRVHSGPAVYGLPLTGLTVLLAWLLSRSAARIVRQRIDEGDVALTGGQEAARLAAATAIPLAVVCAVIAGLSRGPGITPSPRTAALGALLVGAAAGLWGVRRVWREIDSTPLLQRLPQPLAVVAATAQACALWLTGAGGLLVLAMLIRHHQLAAELHRSLQAGVLGGAVLILLQLALLPNAAIFGLAWLAGPGFALGTGSTVSPSATHVAEVPALPLLAALPGGAPAPGAWVLTGVVVIAMLAALRCSGALSGSPLGRAAAVGALAGVLCSVGLAVVAALVGGPLGAGRLLTVGPSPWRLGLALALELGAGCALGAVLRVLADREPTATPPLRGNV
jgi:hypothetical protein